MKVLLLAKKCPYPAKDGETIAITQMVKLYLNAGFEVTILAINPKKHYIEPALAKLATPNGVKLYLIDADIAWKPLPMLFNLFSKIPYLISRLKLPNYTKRLKHLVAENNFSIVQLEGAFLGIYLDAIPKHTTIITRSHNVEHLIWNSLKKGLSFPLKNYVACNVPKIKRFETDVMRQSNGVIYISSNDREQFKNKFSKQLVIPVLTEENRHKTIFKHPLQFYFLGSLDWKPNIEGLVWFKENVWNTFIENNPATCLHIAGRNPLPNLKEQLSGNGIVFHGEVNNKNTFLNDKHIMVCPLFSGSGMRIKIIEAMANQKAVISTSLGAQGIDYQNDVHLKIANNSAETLEAMTVLYKHISTTEKIASLGQQLVNEQYSFEAYQPVFNEFVRNFVNT